MLFAEHGSRVWQLIGSTAYRRARTAIAFRDSSSRDRTNELRDRTLGVSARAEEVLAPTDHRHDVVDRWPADTRSRFRCCAVHLYAVLRARRRNANSRHLGVLS